MGLSSFLEPGNQLSQIKHVIAVMSGKGGVGKSSVAALLALGLQRLGKQAGILDADITGPSVPTLLGVHERPQSSELGLFPVESASGVKVISLNLLLDQEDQPVIWRGPLIAGAVKQFWNDVVWGDLDYLVVDLPPGTGDAPLTVLQSLPLTGVVIVSSPQDLAVMVVRKAINMARSMDVPILGLVENMSYVKCQHCQETFEIFGPSQGEAVAKAAGIPFLGRMPLEPAMRSLADSGRLHEYRNSVVEEMVQALVQE
jgi:Mrp family chromosome partitioning ATPase